MLDIYKNIVITFYFIKDHANLQLPVPFRVRSSFFKQINIPSSLQ